MPLHDWTRVPAGLFHDFHQSWSIRIKDALNAGILSPGMIALVEQRSGPVEADVLAIEGRRRDAGGESSSAATATLEAASTAIVRRSSRQTYATRANRIVVRHHLGRIVAVIDLVAHIEPIAVGDKLPDMPLFLGQGLHVKVPLESMYVATWDALPQELRIAVESGVLPEVDAT
ncbi:MAG: hypothetical protein KY476_07450 [Planctomycetes bacterium]|nr:hypothetical protein [Planctomycetota bacterium]